MDLVKNIIKMYQTGDNYVEVLAASVRTLDHFLAALKIGSDIITAPFKVLKEWAENRTVLPEDFSYNPNLKPIPYQKINLNKNWQEYNITHELTDKGIEKFCQDWNELIK
ncbi:MAG: Transaldolase [uncultured bacterium]|nr:MAG: Transaldolase [uncultured bacterium]